MGLYLCVFDGDEELDGVEVGAYSDFENVRALVRQHVGDEKRFPTLLLHSDCDGAWSPAEAVSLEVELKAIGEAFSRLPPVELREGWQGDVARTLGMHPANLFEALFDVDGEPLLERMLGLARLAQKVGQPILFQ
jgi:hypothetical protein